MTVANFHAGSWLAGFGQLLDDHHLVVLSDDPERRSAFAATLAVHLAGFWGSQVVRIPGSRVTDLAGFVGSLQHGLGRRRPVQSTVAAVANALRSGEGGVRRRYLIWEDADRLLESDPKLFGRLTRALLSVAVEHEFISPDPLILSRVVFTGGPRSGDYARQESGHLRCWHDGGSEDWFFDEVERWVERPPVDVYEL